MNNVIQEIFSAATRYLVDKEGPGELFIDIAKQYPDQDLISLDVLGKQFLVNDPALLADLLVHNCYDFSKPRRTHRYMRYIVGDGLIVVEEDEHKFLRKNTMPAFRFRHIKELYPMMWAKSVILATKLREEMESSGPDGSSVVEISSWASKVTLDIIGVAALGRDLDSVKKGDDPLQQLYESVTDTSMKKVIFTIMGLALGFKTLSFFPWKLSTQFFSESISLHSICRDMVKEKTEAIAKKEDDHFDILSLLIKANNMDDEALKDSLLTFLGAG